MACGHHWSACRPKVAAKGQQAIVNPEIYQMMEKKGVKGFHLKMTNVFNHTVQTKCL